VSNHAHQLFRMAQSSSESSPITVAQAKSFPVGTPIPCIVGTLASVYEYKQNVGKFQSTLQNAVLRDSSGADIRLVIWGHSDYSDRRGQPVRLVGVMEKGKCSTTTKENSYNGKTTIELAVSKASIFLFPDSQFPASSSDDQDVPAPTQTPQKPTAVTGHSPVTAVANPTGGQFVNGATVGNCMKMAVEIWIAQSKLDEMPDDHFIQKIHKTAGDLIQVSKKLEHGHFCEEDIGF
jgi:hypothetical protein